jgi:hypothetical protein
MPDRKKIGRISIAVDTVGLETSYREACRKMLMSIDLRSKMHTVSGEVAELHRALAEQGAAILADPHNDAALQVYRDQVAAMVAKLDERAEIREKDIFGDALHQLLEYGEELGFARRARPIATVAVAASHYAAPGRPVAVPNPPVGAMPDGEASLSAVERELAQLQSQLATIQTGAI